MFTILHTIDVPAFLFIVILIILSLLWDLKKILPGSKSSTTSWRYREPTTSMDGELTRPVFTKPSWSASLVSALCVCVCVFCSCAFVGLPVSSWVLCCSSSHLPLPYLDTWICTIFSLKQTPKGAHGRVDVGERCIPLIPLDEVTALSENLSFFESLGFLSTSVTSWNFL